MNAASWVILLVVLAIVGLAVKSVFFKKKSKGGCCDVGDAEAPGRSGRSGQGDESACAECSSCSGCAGCDGFAARNTLNAVYREAK